MEASKGRQEKCVKCSLRTTWSLSKDTTVAIRTVSGLVIYHDHLMTISFSNRNSGAN